MDDFVMEHICKDNDNRIVFYGVDGKLDELHIADELGEDWTVIGYKDLMLALERARNKIRKMNKNRRKKMHRG